MLNRSSRASRIVLGVTLAALGTLAGCRETEQPISRTTSTPALPQADGEAAPSGALAPAAARMLPLDIRLPAPAFRGTPVPFDEPNVEKPLGRPRGVFLAPEGAQNLARGRPVTASDPAPIRGELDLVNDGDKEASDFGCLELRRGPEWVQIDLEEESTVYAVLVWHNHAEARVYRDVVVQISDDPDCLEAHTVYNNDFDNSSGLGIGAEPGYVETSEGKLIDCKGFEGRYVRLHSCGSNIDARNHYTEIEVYGLSAR